MGTIMKSNIKSINNQMEGENEKTKKEEGNETRSQDKPYIAYQDRNLPVLLKCFLQHLGH